MEYNAEATGEKYKDIAKAMGVENVDSMNQEEYRNAAVKAVKDLAKEVHIPENLKEIVDEKDLDFLAKSAFEDACLPGNPRDTSLEEIKNLYKELL